MKFANKVLGSPFLNSYVQWSARQLAPAAIDQVLVMSKRRLYSVETGELKEWVFAMDLALKTLAFEDVDESVDYTASFLQGKARLWFIASQETSIQFLDWPPLRTKLGDLYGLLHDKKQARFGMYSSQEGGELESYVNEFSRLSLSVPELDEHSRTVLFANGQAQK